MLAPLPITVRETRPQDAAELSVLINQIIAIGGTTAHEEPFSAERFRDELIVNDGLYSSLTAVGPDGRLLGFQIISNYHDMQPGWGDVGTFTLRHGGFRGVGTALFAASRARALSRGLVALNATIRADNVGGQAYYAKMGFVIYSVDKAVPLMDGTLVDRINRRHDLVPEASR